MGPRNLFGRARRPADDPAPPPGPPAVRPGYPSSSARLDAAKREIDGEVGRITTLAGKAPELVFAQQHARKAQWLAQVEETHLTYLGELDRRRLAAVATENDRADDLKTATETTDEVREQLDEAVAALGKGAGAAPRNPEPYPGGRIGTPSSELVGWLFVPLAVGADIAAFYTVLALLFAAAPQVVVLGTVGFAAAAVGLAHTIGIGIKRRRLRMRHTSSGLYWGSLLAWVGLGVVAFAARLNVEPVRVGQEVRPLVLAGTFAILYVVSGVLAMTAAFAAFNPGVWAARKAARLLAAAESVRSGASRAWEAAVADRVGWDNEIARADDRRTTALTVVEADDAVAEKYAHVAILRRLDEMGDR